jgi:hypothetical protein
MTELHANSAISTVGESSANAKPGERPSQPPRSKDAKWYHDQIARLEAQLPTLDAQIRQLQAAIDGRALGDGKDSARPTGVRGGDWRLEQAQLQKKRDDIQARVSALEDQARHQGVPESALP